MLILPYPGIDSGGDNMATVSKSAALARLGDVPEEKRFWCRDGRYLKNLDELKVALEQMTDETFQYHSNEAKTDFSNWVRDVIGDEKLAKDLLGCTSQAQAAKSIETRIYWLKNRAGIL
jgi:hypothetical protein